MLKLDPEEKILIALNHHWIALVAQAALILILIIVPLAIFPFIAASSNARLLAPLFFFIASLWFLITLLLAFIFWSDYYLDVLIITTRRIININQEGVFRREVAEFRLDNVQDIKIEVPNFFATMMHYGNLTVETASESSFTIKEVPRVYEAKDLILKYSRTKSETPNLKSETGPNVQISNF